LGSGLGCFEQQLSADTGRVVGRYVSCAFGSRLTLSGWVGVSPAAAANPEDRQVLNLDMKPVFVVRERPHRIQEGVGEIEYGSTVSADQVMVAALAQQLVLGMPPTQLRLTDQVQGLQEVQRSVDGRDVQIGVGRTNGLVDLFCADVTLALGDGFEDHHALGGKSISYLLQGLDNFVVMTHGASDV
jgi:hypothetical protein